MIEKKKKPDYITSFNPSDFQDYVNFFKLKYFDAYKKKKVAISKKEIIYCRVMGKFAVSNKIFEKGEKIQKKFIKFLRTSKIGLTRDKIDKLIKTNFVFKKKITKNSVLIKNNFYK